MSGLANRFLVLPHAPWPKADTEDLLVVMRLSGLCNIHVRCSTSDESYILQFKDTGETKRYATSKELREEVVCMATAIRNLRIT